MAYIVMSRNAIDGFLVGHFQEIPGLYLKAINRWESTEGANIDMAWTNNLFDAMRFASERQAKDEIQRIWGLDFSNREVMILSVNPKGLEASTRQHKDAKEATK